MLKLAYSCAAGKVDRAAEGKKVTLILLQEPQAPLNPCIEAVSAVIQLHHHRRLIQRKVAAMEQAQQSGSKILSRSPWSMQSPVQHDLSTDRCIWRSISMAEDL